MIDILEELFKSEEQKRKEEEAIARNQAIMEQEVLDYTRRQEVMAMAEPRRAPDVPKPKPVSELTPEEELEILRTQTAPLSSPRAAGAERDLQPTAQVTDPLAVSPAQAKIQGHSYYNQDALASYLKRKRDAGETPNFTNIPGAGGFMINSNVGGVAKPPAPSSVDGKFSEIADPYTYTDAHKLVRDKYELELAIQNDLTDTLTRIEEEEGVTRLEQQLGQLVQYGWQDTEAARGLGAQLQAARLRAAGRLSIDKQGNPVGLEATPFIRAKQMLGKYDIRAQELAEQQGIDDKLESVQLKTGLSTQAIKLIQTIGGYETPVEVAIAPPDVKRLAQQLSSRKSIDLGEVIATMPEATDFYVKYAQANRTPDEAATIATTAASWKDRVENAGMAAQSKITKLVREAKTSGAEIKDAQAKSYKLALDTGEEDMALAILEAADRNARIQELQRAKEEMISSWLAVDKLDPSVLIGVSEADREIAMKAIEIMKKRHGDSFPTSLLEKFGLRNYFYSEGVDPNKATELMRRMLRNQVTNFNQQYSSTLGATMTTETPELKFWGL